MKVLFVTPQLPHPPRQGTSIRTYNLMVQLARRHTLSLVSFTAPGEHLPSQSPLWQLCGAVQTVPQPLRSSLRRGLDTLSAAAPDMALRLDSQAMHRLVRAMAEEWRPDVIQIEGIEMAPFARRHSDAKLVFDNHNAEYVLQKRMALADLHHPQRWIGALYSLIQWQKLRRYEAHVCAQADAVVTVSPEDQAALRRIAPLTPMAVVPNGIELGTYPFRTVKRPYGDDSRPGERGPILLFLGKMDYRPNVDAALWFARRVLPLVQAGIPQVRFQIVGMNPHPRLQSLPANPGVEIIGTVPEVQPYLQRADVLVAPLRVGGGTRFKILEAMACGVPVVSTTLGVEGIPVRSGREVLLADTPAAFAGQIMALLQGDDGPRLASTARRFVELNYTWERLVPTLDALYQTIAP